jgi:hypothetical protein
MSVSFKRFLLICLLFKIVNHPVIAMDSDDESSFQVHSDETGDESLIRNLWTKCRGSEGRPPDKLIGGIEPTLLLDKELAGTSSTPMEIIPRRLWLRPVSSAGKSTDGRYICRDGGVFTYQDRLIPRSVFFWKIYFSVHWIREWWCELISGVKKLCIPLACNSQDIYLGSVLSSLAYNADAQETCADFIQFIDSLGTKFLYFDFSTFKIRIQRDRVDNVTRSFPDTWSVGERIQVRCIVCEEVRGRAVRVLGIPEFSGYFSVLNYGGYIFWVQSGETQDGALCFVPMEPDARMNRQDVSRLQSIAEADTNQLEQLITNLLGRESQTSFKIQVFGLNANRLYQKEVFVPFIVLHS